MAGVSPSLGCSVASRAAELHLVILEPAPEPELTKLSNCVGVLHDHRAQVIVLLVSLYIIVNSSHYYGCWDRNRTKILVSSLTNLGSVQC